MSMNDMKLNEIVSEKMIEQIIIMKSRYQQGRALE